MTKTRMNFTRSSFIFLRGSERDVFLAILKVFHETKKPSISMLHIWEDVCKIKKVCNLAVNLMLWKMVAAGYISVVQWHLVRPMKLTAKGRRIAVEKFGGK